MADDQNKLNGSKNGGLTKDKDILDPTKSGDKKSKSAGESVQDIRKKVDDVKKAGGVAKNVITFLTSNPVGWVIGIILIIIIVVVGVYYFFTTIPGLAMSKLKAIASAALDSTEAIFVNKAVAFTNEDSIVELANYLEELDYDLVGNGFIVPTSTTTSEYPTYENLIDAGYSYGITYYDSDGDGEKESAYRYYMVDEDEIYGINDNEVENDKGEMGLHDGYYYNSLGVLIDNSTGNTAHTGTTGIFANESNVEYYVDQYGLYRSTEDLATSGQGKIVSMGDADVELLKTYLFSDYRIYVIKNYDTDVLGGIYEAIKGTFGGTSGAWAKGMLMFYISENGVATSKWTILKNQTTGESIKINGTKMTIKNGYFNNSITFDIDGWADRYGLSLEFLLSLHLATGAPDLVYAMLQSFDTEVQVYLETTGDSTVESEYVDLFNENATMDDAITLSDVREILAEGRDDDELNLSVFTSFVNDKALTQWVDSLVLGKKACQYLLTHSSLESPDNCTGQAHAYVIEMSTSDSFIIQRFSSNVLKDYGITRAAEEADNVYEDGVYELIDEYEEYEVEDNSFNFNASNMDVSLGTDKSEYETDDYYSYFEDSDSGIDMSDYNYVEDKAEIEEPIIDEYETTVMNALESYSNQSNTIESYTIYNIKRVKIERNYTGEVDGEEVDYTWTTFKYLIYKAGKRSHSETYVSEGLFEGEWQYTDTDDLLDEPEWVDTVIFEIVIREKTDDELVEAGLATYDEETDTYTYINASETKCSSDPTLKKCCKNCQEYVKAVVQALANVSDQDYEAYTPYIARVLGSWFRDTYFVIPESRSTDGVWESIFGSDEEDVEADGDVAITNYMKATNRTDEELAQIENSYGNDSILVVVDEDYLAETGEYWTKYDTDPDTGDYILYYMYPDGTTSNIRKDEFLESDANKDDDGNKIYSSLDEAEEAGVAFVKKAETKYVTNISTSSTTLTGVVWSAYEYGTDGDTGWIKINYSDQNGKVNTVYDIAGYTDDGDNAGLNSEGGFYYKLLTSQTVTQTEDAQRSQTNSTVKWLFKYRKYYLYDGSSDTALAIAEDKENVINAVVAYLYQESQKSVSLGNWATTGGVATDLGLYGRSALREQYNNLIIKGSWYSDTGYYSYNEEGVLVYDTGYYAYDDDGVLTYYSGDESVAEINSYDLAEAWLEWQLDMYYSGDTDEVCSEHPNQGKLFVLDQIDWSEYLDLEDGETRDVDPRDPDLIGTVNITKNSLNSFSILENTETLAAEYAYRDFKELIVELDYFDKEDLSDAISSVFTWVLPDITATGWPNRPWDKQDNDYGALIESSTTYDYLEEVDYDPTTMSVIATSDDEESTDDTSEDTSTDNTSTDTTDTTTTDTTGDTTDDTTEDTTEETTTTVEEDKIYFLGDSWINFLNGKSFVKSTYIHGKDGATATTEEVVDNVKADSDSSAIVIHLGLNDITGWENTQSLVNNVINRNSGIPVYVLALSHVASDSTSTVTNDQIDEYNSQMKSYCESTEGVTYIDPTTNIVDSDGYMKSEYEGTGGYHVNEDGCEVWYNDIISAINSSSSSSTSTSVSFEGYEGGEAVVSPVTGRVLSYGTHERTNVYTGDTEIVGYITIEAMKTDNQISSSDVSVNSASDEGNDDITDEEISTAYGYFAEEYEDTCQGYVITIDGINVDLNLTVDDAYGVYEKNEVAKLYNSQTQSEREDKENLKYDAPFFINVGGSDNVGSLLEVTDYSQANVVYSYSDDCTYYIKEGKYIGTTMTDEEAEARVTEEGSTIAQELTYGEEDGDVTTSEFVYEGPANYIRIMMKDLEYSTIDNIEDYFDIPEPEDTSSNASLTGDAELLDMEILFFTIGEGGPWMEYNSTAGSYFMSRTDNPNGLTFVANKKAGDNLEIGIIQWTTNLRGLTGIQDFCASAVEYDSSIFGALQGYTNVTSTEYCSKSSLWSSLQSDVLDIWNSNPDELMAFEIQYAKEGYLDPCLEAHPWLAERSGVVQGMVMSIQVYKGNINMLSLSEDMSDEEIIDECQPYLSGRTWQTGFANAYLNGEISEEQLKEFIYYGTIDGVAGTSLYN